MDVLCHRVAITCGAGGGEKTSERSARKALMNCPGRESEGGIKNAECRMKSA